MHKVLIVGQGNIGTFVGAALHFAGIPVDHLVRTGRQRPDAVELAFNDRRPKPFALKKGAVYAYATTTDVHSVADYDCVLVPVADHHLQDALQAMLPYLQARQTVVVMGNVWDAFDWIEAHLKAPCVFAFPNFGGALLEGKLHGWLTPRFTTGITRPEHEQAHDDVRRLLVSAGFAPRHERCIKDWLLTHYAYNAGMLLQAARNGGFQGMSRRMKYLKAMYRAIRACMLVVQHLGVSVRAHREGREAFRPLWWNALKTYLIFRIPGLAKSADAGKDLETWEHFGKKVWETAQARGVDAPVLKAYFDPATPDRARS